MDPHLPKRRSIRLKGYDYSLEGAYFVTISTYQHKCLFGDIIDGKMQLNGSGQIVSTQWLRLSQRFHPSDFSVFTIMPNHVHGIIRIGSDVGVGMERGDAVIPPPRPYSSNPITSNSPGAIVRAYKSSVPYRLNLMRRSASPPIWQRNYYEHIIRNEKENKQILDYIEMNTMSWPSDRLNSVSGSSRLASR